MNLENVLESKLVADIGWTLLHSVWQIGLVSVLLFVILRGGRHFEPRVRYAIAVFALIVSVILPVSTFIKIATDVETSSPSGSSTSSLIRDERGPAINGLELVAGEGREASTVGVGSTTDNFFSRASELVSRALPDLLPFAVLMWIFGVGFSMVRISGGFAQLRQYKSSALDLADAAWLVTFSRLRAMTGAGENVRLLASDTVRTPIAIGILRPVIIIPASLFLQISPDQLETIIAHELIHIRRYDPLVNVFQCVVEALFFYHPGVWWISGQIRREREFAADAVVTDLFKGSHVTYARALANLEEIRLATDEQMPRYATAANGGNFMQRIQRILNIKTEARMANSAWTAGLALVLTSAFLLAVFSFSSSQIVNGQRPPAGRSLAIAFVSIPPVDRTSNAPKDSDATARLLIQKLKEYKVPATGFLQGGMVSDGEKLFPVRANIARMWREAGFEIGLGGFKHVKLYNTPADDYIANIEKNERVAKLVFGNSAKAPRYFSYPFLNTGKSLDDQERVERWLASQGLTSVKYTFDNQEWMYSFAYDMARNDNDVNTMAEIREAYIDYMTKMFDHYEAYSTDLFGRDIAQTLVLTPSRLITDTADEFFAMATKRGYKFVSLDEAQSDPAYRSKDEFVGEAGISWFERWSMAKGSKLRTEPDVDPIVQKIWDDRKIAAKK